MLNLLINLTICLDNLLQNCHQHLLFMQPVSLPVRPEPMQVGCSHLSPIEQETQKHQRCFFCSSTVENTAIPSPITLHGVESPLSLTHLREHLPLHEISSTKPQHSSQVSTLQFSLNISTGTITQCTAPIQLHVSGLHQQHITFLVTITSKHPVNLGLPWMQLHNPQIFGGMERNHQVV